MRHLVEKRQCGKQMLRLFALVFLFGLVVAASRAWGDDAGQSPTQSNNQVRAVRLSDVEGSVQVMRGGQTAFDQAHDNMPVLEGMQVKTGDDGRAEIQFEDGSVARVTPNSSISLEKLGRDQDGTTVTVIGAVSGLSYYELNGQASQYSVRFGPDTVVPTDSSIFRIDLDQNPGTLAVTHGTVHVENGQGGGFDVRTNQTANIDAQDPANYDVADSVAANSWDQWNSDRDQLLARMDKSETTARGGTGSPDDPGWSDLDYYGDWYDMPGYGMGWSPAGVGAGFDPFGAGYWGYYNTIGYTWISSYPWGWWPYHCGAWNYFDNNGWMWFPGGCGYGAFGGGWYPYASVWNVPQNYQPPARPTVIPPRGGVHMPPQHRLVTVNRTPGQRFRAVGAPKPTPRPFRIGNNRIRPIAPTVHPREAGPTGESFTTAAGQSGFVNSRPGAPGFGMIGPGMPESGGIREMAPPRGYSGARLGYMPRGVHALPSQPRLSPPPSFHAPVNRGGGFNPGGGFNRGGGFNPGGGFNRGEGFNRGGSAPAPRMSAPAMSAPRMSAPRMSAPNASMSGSHASGGAAHR